jgi:Retrotransposon gag protein
MILQQSPTQRSPSPFEGPYSDLVGNPPEFDGDRANAISFLEDFEIFIELNCDTRIARDPIKRAAYFLNITGRPSIAVNNWMGRNIKWFYGVRRNPDLLPEGMNAWDVLKADFEKSFEDYLGPEMAPFKLQELRMEEDCVDDYIAQFEGLARSARYDLNEPLAIRYFIQGLPRKLAKDCIDNRKPESFDQWASAAREQFLIRRLIKAYSKERNSRQLANRDGPRTTPRDSNASTGVVYMNGNGKVITEEDKESYRREGRCFHCRTKGHIARNCPDRARTRSCTTIEKM